MVGHSSAHSSSHSSSHSTAHSFSPHGVALMGARGGHTATSSGTTQAVTPTEVGRLPQWMVAGWCILMVAAVLALIVVAIVEGDKAGARKK